MMADSLLNPKEKRLRILSHIVVVYMFLAFAWWTILLLNKNRDAFEAQKQLITLSQTPGPGQVGPASADYLESLALLEQDHRRQRNMILGEGLFFVIALLIGIWLINRGYTQELNAAKQRRNFLLAITHELRSPLTSIKVILETLERPKLPEEEKRKLIPHGLAETERLSLLINNLLLSARLESSYKPHFRRLDVVALTEEVVKQLQAAHPSARIRVDSEHPSVECSFDQAGLSMVLHNLVENAVKYSDEPAEIEIYVEDKRKRVQIRVSDQGMGISDKEKGRVFDQFYRVGNEETRSTQGTGLGLFIASKIVELHEGDITVKDNQPKGSIFAVTLPKNLSDANSAG